MITVDQVISGASNVLIAILAARLLSAAQFGLFGIVFLVYTILVWVTRGLVSDTLLVHPVESRERPGDAIGTALVLAMLLAAGLAGVAALVHIWNPTLGVALLVLAGCLPLLVLQDVGRYLGFAVERPARAMLLDTVWLVLMVGAVAGLFVTGTHTLAWLVAAWAGSGAVAGLFVFASHGLFELQLGFGWLRRTWRVAWRFVVSYAAMQTSALGISAEVGTIAGATALGGVQGTLVLVRPFTTFQVAAMTHWIGEAARSAGRRQVWGHALAASGVSAAVAAVTMTVMLVLPNGIGETLLGASWQPAKPLLLPTALQLIILGLLTGPQAGLLGLRAMNKAMAIGITTTVVSLIMAGAGAALGGAKGALWLVDAGQAVVMVVWWATLATHLRRIEAPAAAAFTAPQAGARAKPPAPAAARRGRPADVVSNSPV